MAEIKRNLYLTDDYISLNPSLHEEDSSWKVNKLIPFIDMYLDNSKQNDMNLLDVGGGAGLILKGISDYIKSKRDIAISKYIIDLSPGILKVQQMNNPDIKYHLNKDIRDTDLKDKEIDLVLMIDVLEHVPGDIAALKELRRISKYTIIKVPLEKNLFIFMKMLFTKHSLKDRPIDYDYGHVNFYNYPGINKLIHCYLGNVLKYSFTNVFKYFLNSKHYKAKMNLKAKVFHYIALVLYRISPGICSYIFSDFVIFLVRNY
jgi:ubiquinone/menaquinone biosynthesis C-methylase UbiE